MFYCLGFDKMSLNLNFFASLINACLQLLRLLFKPASHWVFHSNKGKYCIFQTRFEASAACIWISFVSRLSLHFHCAFHRSLFVHVYFILQLFSAAMIFLLSQLLGMSSSQAALIQTRWVAAWACVHLFMVLLCNRGRLLPRTNWSYLIRQSHEGRCFDLHWAI